LKENVIMGHLIPAGTGLKYLRDLMLTPPEGVDEAEEPEELEAGAKKSKREKAVAE
jgi:hypothetical protein